MTDEKLIITYTPKCHHIYISFTVLYLFFCSHKCMSQYLWLWNCALFHSTKLVIVGPSGSSYKLYTVPCTQSILPPSSADKTLAMLLLIPILSISHCTHHPCIFPLNTVNCPHIVHVLSKCLYIVAAHSVNNLYIIVNETLSILHEGIQ